MDLTPYEFSLLLDHKQKNDKQKYKMLRNTVFNAGANLLKSKDSKEIPLFDDEDGEHNETSVDIQLEREMLFGKQAE